MLGIGLYYNIFSLLCVKYKHYPEHDTLYISIFFYWVFLLFSFINDTMFPMLLRQMFWNYLARLTSFVCVKEFIRICESNIFDPVS